jgi:hypothetical protein
LFFLRRAAATKLLSQQDLRQFFVDLRYATYAGLCMKECAWLRVVAGFWPPCQSGFANICDFLNAAVGHFSGCNPLTPNALQRPAMLI